MVKPTKPGFYWALWLKASKGTHEGDELTPANDWEIVEVWENFSGDPCEADQAEKFGVSVTGVQQTQWIDNFKWGRGPIGQECDYEEIVKSIQDASITQLPALLITVVEACCEKKPFNPGGIERCVAKTLERRTEIEAIELKGRRCQKCQSVMIHTRLGGYRCNRGCQ